MTTEKNDLWRMALEVTNLWMVTKLVLEPEFEHIVCIRKRSR